MLLSSVKRIADTNATFGTSGNASERDQEDHTLFWITPSGLSWSDTTQDDLVQIELTTGSVAAGYRKPSSEWRAHQAIYQLHTWVGGVVHLHSHYATVLSVIGSPVRAVHYQLARVADEVPILPYQTFGSPELADALAQAIAPNVRAVLLENHGLFAVGDTVDAALVAADEVEWTAMIQYQAMLAGHARILSHQELERVRAAFRHYGQETLPD